MLGNIVHKNHVFKEQVMKRLRVTENNITVGKIIGEILEIYANENVRESEVPAQIMAAVTPGHEGLLLRHRVWTKCPTDYRLALAEVVVNIEGLASNWRRETGTNFIPPAVEAIEYMTNLLALHISVTITYSESYSPTATILASGYKDMTVYFGSMMLVLTAMGFSGELGGQPEDIFPIYLSV
jgi:hypothetical protein